MRKASAWSIGTTETPHVNAAPSCSYLRFPADLSKKCQQTGKHTCRKSLYEQAWFTSFCTGAECISPPHVVLEVGY